MEDRELGIKNWEPANAWLLGDAAVCRFSIPGSLFPVFHFS